MAVCLVLLEQSSVLGGMSSHLYYSSMSLIILSSQFAPVCTLDRVTVDVSFSRDCTSKNELEESLKKSIWPPGVKEMAWNFDS